MQLWRRHELEVEATEMKSTLRKKQFVDRTVQGGLTKRILLHWSLFFAIALAVLPLWQFIIGWDGASPPAQYLAAAFRQTLPVLFVLLTLLPVFIWDTIKFSNRFAGPMSRFFHTIRKAADGEDVEPIKFRDGDFWTQAANDFNRLMARMNADEPQDVYEADDELMETQPIETLV